MRKEEKDKDKWGKMKWEKIQKWEKRQGEKRNKVTRQENKLHLNRRERGEQAQRREDLIIK